LLVETGQLKAAATGGPGSVTKASDRQLITGVDKGGGGGGIPGAGVHQYGYGAVPKREFLGPPEDELAKIDELIADAGLELIG
jgi:hypothetical protein